MLKGGGLQRGGDWDCMGGGIAWGGGGSFGPFPHAEFLGFLVASGADTPGAHYQESADVRCTLAFMRTHDLQATIATPLPHKASDEKAVTTATAG